MQNISKIIESLLFAADEPLTVEKLKKILETPDTTEVRSALHLLVERYETWDCAFRLCEVAGGWQLRSRPEYHKWIKRMLQPSPQRLSKAALETLAIVAYNQPIIRADVEHIRGVDSGGVLRQLLERKLIRVLGRKEIPGRPMIYATTKLFLELFDLKDLKDLPTPKEMEEMTASVDLEQEKPQEADLETHEEASFGSKAMPSEDSAFIFRDSNMIPEPPMKETAFQFEFPVQQDAQTPSGAVRRPRESFTLQHLHFSMPFKILATPHKIAVAPPKITTDKGAQFTPHTNPPAPKKP